MGHPDGFKSNFDVGNYLLWADGSVTTVSPGADLQDLRAAFTRSGGEEFALPEELK